MTKASVDLAHIVSGLATILKPVIDVAQIDTQDKALIDEALKAMADAASKFEAPVTVTIKQSDIDKAVASVLPDMVAKAVADEVTARFAPKS